MISWYTVGTLLCGTTVLAGVAEYVLPICMCFALIAPSKLVCFPCRCLRLVCPLTVFQLMGPWKMTKKRAKKRLKELSWDRRLSTHVQTSVKTDRICTDAKSNPRPAGIGGSFKPAAPVLVTRALTNYTGELFAELKKWYTIII